jgi:hypothetical protein
MVINQYQGIYATPTGTSGGNAQFVIDRWSAVISQASKLTFAQGSGSGPVGFNNYLTSTVSTPVTIGAGDYFLIQQTIEGANVIDLAWGTANAKAITISFWAFASTAGTYSVAIRNVYSSFYSYIAQYTIASANTWQYFSITVPGPTVGTWPIAYGSGGIYLSFNLGAGSTFTTSPNTWTSGNYVNATGSVNIMGTSSANFYITGVQFEVGTQATSFDWRPVGTEIQLSQRYAFVIRGPQASNNYPRVATGGYAQSSTTALAYRYNNQWMANTPAVVVSGSIALYNGVTITPITTMTLDLASTVYEIGFSCSGASGLTTNAVTDIIINNSSTAYVILDAELR